MQVHNLNTVLPEWQVVPILSFSNQSLLFSPVFHRKSPLLVRDQSKMQYLMLVNRKDQLTFFF